MEPEITLAQFIEQHHIEMTAKYLGNEPGIRPDMEHNQEYPMFHWLVTFKIDVVSAGLMRQLATMYSMGAAHVIKPRHSYDKPRPRRPTVAEVLDCLASDAAGFDNARRFEDWASDYGYDPDSRMAERIYLACGEEARKLRAFLGHDAYQTLLYNVERL